MNGKGGMKLLEIQFEKKKNENVRMRGEKIQKKKKKAKKYFKKKKWTFKRFKLSKPFQNSNTC